MRLLFFSWFLVVCFFFVSQGAEAARWWHFFFDPGVPSFEKRLLNDGKTFHMQQWAHGPWPHDTIHNGKDGGLWTPDVWLQQYGGNTQKVIDELYHGDILRRHSQEGGLHSFHVGEGFMRLSDLGKLRIARFIDFAYAVTGEHTHGTITFYHYKSKEMIGAYTTNGLHLQ